MKNIQALKTYFEAEPHGRKVTMDELKNLSKDDRNELGRLACEQMGETWEPSGEATPDA